MKYEQWKTEQHTQKNKKEAVEKKIKKSLLYSVFDGSFHSAMVGFGESFFSAFAVFLKASTTQIGLLGSLPQTLGSLSQLLSSYFIRLFKSRKNFLCTAVLLQALLYIPIALVFFFGDFRVYHLILFIGLYFIFGMIASPAWSSWMGDLVSADGRGAYFGKRNTIAGFVSFFSLLTAGYVLQHFSTSLNLQYLGFVLIFLLAFVFRMISFSFLVRKYEPSYTEISSQQIHFFDFIRGLTSRNYGLFMIFRSVMNFSVYIASPFFAAYMLYDLQLDYLHYTLLIASSILSKYISMPVWGKAADRYGTKKVLTLAGFLMPAVSLFWLVSGNWFYLIFVQAYSGFVWAGFEIASFNFLFETIIPQKRASYIAYYNVLNGIALFLGATLGGLIAKHNQIFLSGYLLVFLLSGIFRYLTSFAFIPSLQEVRFVDKITYPRLFMHVVTTMTTRGLVYEAVTFLKKKKN